MDKVMPLDEVIAELTAKYAGQVAKVDETLQVAIRVQAEVLFQVMKELKEQYGLGFLTDLTAVDLEEEGLKGIYHVMSWKPYQTLRVEVPVSDDNPRLPSLVDIWSAANVQEREAFDMFGIVYEGHPKLTRILLSDNFEGYPLRKNFRVPSRR